jgi:hypothetical protein
MESNEKHTCPERQRMEDDRCRKANWKRWGPYLAERQWGTVREDYSDNSDSWRSFTHEDAVSRAYRWGEDGLLGITDRQGRLSFALALWNGKDPILKERLFGLTGPEGNHGEDVKEHYFYLDSSPTHSYLKALYKYPQCEFPYQQIRDENAKRGFDDLEYEIEDTGAFNENRYFDVVAEYSKNSPNDVLIRITVTNCGPESASLHLLPTLWFRNTWSFGRSGEGYWPKPRISKLSPGQLESDHASLGRFRFFACKDGEEDPRFIFTDNETNYRKLFGQENAESFVKDAFHEHIIGGHSRVVHPAQTGTKAAAVYEMELEPGESRSFQFRLVSEAEMASDDPAEMLGSVFDETFASRIAETDSFYSDILSQWPDESERDIARQAFAGLFWTKQFYFYSVRDWLRGDPGKPKPGHARTVGRNSDWSHLYNRDVISMPDKWEYPWYAAWDLAFHMVPFAKVDIEFAKDQLLLLLREWYMHPNGQIPAYEFQFGDCNPPVHAWAAWQVYQDSDQGNGKDRAFLSRVFHKLLINFTWWINRKDRDDNNIFSGGFLGLDNIGVFDRSQPEHVGGDLDQADATAWMAFYCTTMLTIALELASFDESYEDVASKFFEHFVSIADAMNSLGNGLWDEEDGFYYDQLHQGDNVTPLKIRSMVGLLPIIAVGVLNMDLVDRLPGFRKRMVWFLENRKSLASQITYLEKHGDQPKMCLAIPSKSRLTALLRYMLDETEFLSEHGVRSMSKFHEATPYEVDINGRPFSVRYKSGESDSGLFGGNSNWRGPVWFPVNWLLIEALDQYHDFYGDSMKVECPVGSGNMMNLKEVADEIARRLTTLFVSENGKRPVNEGREFLNADPLWNKYVLFHEYFDGDTGRGLGASHQTGWTALVINCFDRLQSR